MLSHPLLSLNRREFARDWPSTPNPPVDYAEAAQLFSQLLNLDNLDRALQAQPEIQATLLKILASALEAAYGQTRSDAAAHLFLQRLLYRLNRLKLFWYDDLRHYSNEDSLLLHQIRHQIETKWQAWELGQIDLKALQQEEVESGLRRRAAADLAPPLSAAAHFFQEEMSLVGYQRLLAIAALEGLVEASRLSFTLGGAAHPVQATLTRIFLEEYGNGHLNRKHSTFFAQMLAALNMKTEPEAYFDLVPWEVLASINLGFLFTSRKRYFLRYAGGLTYFELAVPAVHRRYLRAAQRLGLPAAAMSYWDLHIREDQRHGRWMLEQVALPLATAYAAESWELLLGYDQERRMGDRASQAMLESIYRAEAAA